MWCTPLSEFRGNNSDDPVCMYVLKTLQEFQKIFTQMGFVKGPVFSELQCRLHVDKKAQSIEK